MPTVYRLLPRVRVCVVGLSGVLENALAMFELNRENAPVSLPLNVMLPFCPEASSLMFKVSEYWPPVLMLSGVAAGAELKMRKLVATMSELPVAVLGSSVVKDTPPVPGLSALIEEPLGVQEYDQ